MNRIHQCHAKTSTTCLHSLPWHARRSFTRAAAQLGVSQSALSHTIRALETRLGLRLLTRTTRSVSPTEAGERLLETVAPRFDEIEAELISVTELRDVPAGKIRITATDYATKTILWPKLSKVLKPSPEIKVEIITDYGLSDIVADRYDIGVRNGDQVAKDMIAVRIAPDMRMAIVGSPTYLQKRHAARGAAGPDGARLHPFASAHARMAGSTLGELKKGPREVQVRVEVASLLSTALIRCSTPRYRAMALAYVPADVSAAAHHGRPPRLGTRRMVSDLLRIACLPYASRRQSSRAMTVVIDALRYRT